MKIIIQKKIIYSFKNNSSTNIKRNLKKYINNKKKKIKNLIKDSDFSPEARIKSGNNIEEQKSKKKKNKKY